MFQCPNCGGNARFDVASQQLACDYCGTKIDPYFYENKTSDAQEEKDPEKKERKLAAAFEISRAAGACGMVAGQTADVLAAGGRMAERIHLTEEEKPEYLRYIHKNKTGALIRAAVRAGALVGGAHGQILADLTEYAQKVGLVFQIVDDILDLILKHHQIKIVV